MWQSLQPVLNPYTTLQNPQQRKTKTIKNTANPLKGAKTLLNTKEFTAEKKPQIEKMWQNPQLMLTPPSTLENKYWIKILYT